MEFANRCTCIWISLEGLTLVVKRSQNVHDIKVTCEMDIFKFFFSFQFSVQDLVMCGGKGSA